MGDGDLVLFPPISEDPNDPLRWSKWRKYVAFGNMCVLAFLSNVAAAGIYPAFVQIGIEFNTGYAKVTQLSSYLILVLGCSVSQANLISVDANIIYRILSGYLWPYIMGSDLSSLSARS